MPMDDFALERYIRLYRKNVCMTAMFYVKNAGDAEDIAQDVFLKLCTFDGTFDSDEHVKAWLLKCAINRCKNLLRSYRYRFTVPLEDAADMMYFDKTDEDSMLQLIAKLGTDSRIALYMHYYEGYTVREIADITGKSESAVTSALRRGRQKLKKMLTERNDEDELQRNN